MTDKKTKNNKNESSENLSSNKERYESQDRLSSAKSEVVNSGDTVVPNFQYVGTTTIVLLSIFTCGIYSYYLIYKWVEVIKANDQEQNGLPSPVVSLLLSIFTCGVGLVYFQYKIPERAAYLTRKMGGNTNPERKSMKPPIGQLPTIALFVNLGIWFFSLVGLVFTAGILNLIALPLILGFYAWLHLSIQRSIEYMLCISPKDN